MKHKGPFKIRLEISGPEGLSRWEDVTLPHIFGPGVPNSSPVIEDHNWDREINILKRKLAAQMDQEFKQ